MMNVIRSNMLSVLAGAAFALAATQLAAQDNLPSKSAVGPLLKLLERDLPPDRIAFMLDVIAQKGNAHDLGVVYAKSTGPAAWSGEVQLAGLKAVASAARTRGVTPEGDLSRLKALLTSDTAKEQPALYELAIELVGLCKVADATHALGEIAVAKATAPRQRTLALAALASIGGDKAKEVIGRLTREDQPPAVRFQGGAALARIDVASAAPLAVELLAAGSVDDDPSALIDAFLEQQTGPDKLAAAVAASNQKISPDVAKLALRHVYSVGRSDEMLVNALSAAAGISTRVEPPTPEELASLIADVQAKGNAERGEQIFRRADMNCIKCHSLNGAGGRVGPDLIDLGGRQSLDYLIESVLLPEKAVKEEFQLAHVTDYTTGKQYQGILKEESEERILLRDANGKEIVVAIADPEEFEIKKGGSLMPSGLVRFLTRDELVDLVKYLSVLGQPETPYAKNTAPIVRRWRVLQDVPPDLLAAVPDEEAFLEHVRAAGDEQWATVFASAAGDLPVADAAALSPSPVVFVQGEIEVTAAGEIGIELFGLDAGALAWVDEARQQGEPKIVVNLEPGKHPVTLRVDPSKAPQAKIGAKLYHVEGSSGKATVANSL
jgi:putative heme-binding domain-containing protein